MAGELDVFGVYVPTLLVIMVVTLPISLAVRRTLAIARVYRFVWHRALFDLAVYVLLVQAMFLLSQRLLP
jgi:protein AaeX